LIHYKAASTSSGRVVVKRKKSRTAMYASAIYYNIAIPFDRLYYPSVRLMDCVKMAQHDVTFIR